MFFRESQVRVFLHGQPVNMRLSFDGGYTLAKHVMHKDPMSGHRFAFINRRASRLRVLGRGRKLRNGLDGPKTAARRDRAQTGAQELQKTSRRHPIMKLFTPGEPYNIGMHSDPYPASKFASPGVGLTAPEMAIAPMSITRRIRGSRTCTARHTRVARSLMPWISSRRKPNSHWMRSLLSTRSSSRSVTMGWMGRPSSYAARSNRNPSLSAFSPGSTRRSTRRDTCRAAPSWARWLISGSAAPACRLT
jgi:hypothetical protein